MSVLSALRNWFAPAPVPTPAPAPAPLANEPEPFKPARVDRPSLAMDSDFMLEAMSRMGAAPGHDPRFNPFDASKLTPPPGIPGGHGLAMDGDAVGNAATAAGWAFSGLAGFLGPREGFIGFPELALLAQRPEYRSPAEIIATEATRKRAKFLASGDADKTDKIKAIEAEFERLGVWSVLRQVSEHDSLYGRGHIFIEINGDVDDDAELKMPIGDGADDMSKLKIGKGSLTALRTVEPVWVWPITYNSLNPLSHEWYRPSTWFVMSKEVHKSRLLTFIAREVPDLLKPAYMFGGQSLTQLLRPVVENWLTTRASVGEIVKKFSHNVIKVNLTEAINSGNADKLFKRIRLFTQSQNNFGTMVLDRESEEFINVSVPLGSLDLLQAQAQEHMSSLSRIPIIKLLGIQPAGLNASSEGELRAFEDTIHSYQEAFFRPNLQTILNLVQASLFGEVDPGITFEFEPITEALTDLERAQAVQQGYSGISQSFESGLLDRATALKEMRAFAETVGVQSAIEDKLIDEAEEGPPTPSPEELKAEAAMVKAERAEALQ